MAIAKQIKKCGGIENGKIQSYYEKKYNLFMYINYVVFCFFYSESGCGEG